MLKTLFCLKIAASDWSVVIISNLPFSLTRGEYLRVVGILEMVEQIGIYFYLFQNVIVNY